MPDDTESHVPPDQFSTQGRLLEVLAEAQRRGFIGRGRLEDHVVHAQELIDVLPASGTVVDLGSGGGLPGLPLLVARPDLHWVLLDSNLRRVQWLEEAATMLGLEASAIQERAETAGRGALRGTVQAVVARIFARAAITAECAAPLLAVGGMLWVAEPRLPPPGADGRSEGSERWPVEPLAELGLEALPQRHGSWQGFRQVHPCSDQYPRRTGMPEKRPLF